MADIPQDAEEPAEADGPSTRAKRKGKERVTNHGRPEEFTDAPTRPADFGVPHDNPADHPAQVEPTSEDNNELDAPQDAIARDWDSAYSASYWWKEKWLATKDPNGEWPADVQLDGY